MQQIEVVSTTDSKEDVSKAKAMYSKKTVETKPAPVEDKTDKGEKAEASEALEKEIVEPEEIEADDVDETEDQENKQNDKPKKKGGFQKRIDKLTKERTLASQERDYWRELALKNGQKPIEKVEPVETKAKQTEGRPDPDNFKNQAEYVEALADWKFDQKQAKAEQSRKLEQAKAEQEKTTTTFQAKTKEFQKTNPDFLEVLEAVDHIPLTPALQDIFLTSENGHELMYDLAKNPEEYERISKLSPTAIYREMGKREAKMSQPSKEVIEPKTTKAPAPVKPVGKSATVSTKDPGEMSYQEYKAWHAKQYGR